MTAPAHVRCPTCSILYDLSWLSDDEAAAEADTVAALGCDDCRAEACAHDDADEVTGPLDGAGRCEVRRVCPCGASVAAGWDGVA